jgi:hypothetical protein
MGISLGWVVFLAAGVTAAPPADKTAAQITYTVKFIEANGVAWREAVFTRLKPVARQGAATVWTLPERDCIQLTDRIMESPTGKVLHTPRVVAFAGVPATIRVRENRTFVTQVAWNGEDAAPRGMPQEMRVGWHTTLVGRKLDQGILVKMVFEDTNVRAVHKVSLNSACAIGTAKFEQARTEAAACNGETASSCPFAHEVNALECGSSCCDAKNAVPEKAIQKVSAVCTAVEPRECDSVERLAMNLDPHELAASMLCFKTKSEPAQHALHSPTDLNIAPVAGRYVCGTWLVSEARENTVDLPEIANQEVLGEWLIPNGECLLVSFGPYTVADKDGKAVVRERLAIVEAEETNAVAMNSGFRFNFTPAPPFATVPHPAPAPVAPMPAPAPLPGPPVAIDPSTTAPASNLPRLSNKLPTPAAPSRSMPQGVHADGSKANLPPLPDDEMDESTESESGEALPSPQTKKTRKLKKEPATDAGTTKASYAPRPSSTVFLPSVFLPGASVGFQFLLPIRPLSIRLPFNQRLEIEIFGRVVPDTRATNVAK